MTRTPGSNGVLVAVAGFRATGEFGQDKMLQSFVDLGSHVSPSAAATDARPHTTTATRWTTLPGEVLDGGEIVLLAIKPSMWRPVFDAAPWLVTCCLLVVMLTWLGSPFSGWTLPATTQAILLVALARLAVGVVRWVPRWYVLTNRRIIDVRGIRSPRISSCPLLDIRTTHMEQSPLEGFTQLGTIVFVTDHEDQVSHIWQSVKDPRDVHARIRRAIENSLDQRGL